MRSPSGTPAQMPRSKPVETGSQTCFCLARGGRTLTRWSCVSALAEACDSTKVILVCERSGEGGVRRALDAGVRALVLLSEAEGALLPVIEVVRAGQVSVPGSRSKEVGRNALTTRERQVLGQVVLGMTNAEIAAKLFLAESTVKSHLSSAFPKLGVTSRSEATALILNPASGVGPGILTMHTEKVLAVR